MNASSYTTTGGLLAATQALRFRQGISDVEMTRRLIARRRASAARARRHFLVAVGLMLVGVVTIGAGHSLGDGSQMLEACVVGLAACLIGLVRAIVAALAGGKSRTGSHLTAAEIPAAPDDVLWIHRRSCEDEALRELVADWITSETPIRAQDVDLVKRFVREKAKCEQRSAAFAGCEQQQHLTLARLDVDLQGA